MAGSRLLLDTNVLVSAVGFGGKPATLLRAARANVFVLVISPHILGELRDVLLRPGFKLTDDDAADFIEAVTEIAEVIAVGPVPLGECRDPDDEHVLLAAVIGGADAIVTGDGDLLALTSPPVPVITVDEALRTLSG